MELLEDLPEEGNQVSTDTDITLLVEKMDNKRIETVHIFLPKEAPIMKDSSEGEVPSDDKQ